MDIITISTMVKSLIDLGFDAQDFINKIFPNGILPFVAQFLAFLVLVLAGIFLGYKPVKRILTERAKYVEGNIKNAEEKNAEAIKHESIARENIDKSEIEARKIINDAKDDAIKAHNQIMSDTQEEVKQTKLQASVEIEQSKKKALEDIHNEIVSVALDASKSILEREINEKDDSILVEQFIKEVDD